MPRYAVLMVAIFCSVCSAQRSTVTGSVSGRVTCADTNAPARLAVVVLRPVPAAKSASSAAGSQAVEARRVQTLLDGSFSIPNVTPGTYLVLVSMEGYVSPLADLGVGRNDLLEAPDDLRKRLLERVPTVSVDADESASINISLERAAAVNGTILYDDGSPAPGIEVQVREHKQGKWVPVRNVAGDNMGSNTFTTDDRGHFRITGLPPMKEAIVEADLSVRSATLNFSKNGYGTSAGRAFSLAFYSGGALRPQNAKPFQLTMGEERPGEDITLPISKLHRVEGVLLAKKDGHNLNKGSVSLLFSDDRTQLGTAAIGPESASFDFSFVPEGDYILKVTTAEDARFDQIPNPPGSVPPFWTKATVVHSYGTAEIPLHVDGDRAGVTIDVPEAGAAAATTGQQ